MIIEIEKEWQSLFLDTNAVRNIEKAGKGYDVKICSDIIYFTKEDMSQMINKILTKV